MGEEIYINPKNVSSMLLPFHMPESAVVFNYLRDKLGPNSFNNLADVSTNTFLSFNTENPPAPKGINRGRIFPGTSYSLSLDCYEIYEDKICKDNSTRVRPSLIYHNRGKVPDELMQFVIKGRLLVRDESIITELITEGTDAIELKGVGKIKVSHHELERETEWISLEYRFWNHLLQGVDANLSYGEKRSTNMMEYNQNISFGSGSGSKEGN